MKVVINRCFGGFGLSEKAIEECIRRGMTVTTMGEDDGARDDAADFIRFDEPVGRQYLWPNHDRFNRLRCHPILVAVVEELGEEADGDCAKLKVVEIPFDGPTGWEIDDYDGRERIVPHHSSWC